MPTMSIEPHEQAMSTDGLTALKPEGTERTEASVRNADKKLGKERSGEVRRATESQNQQWCEYGAGKAATRKREPVGQSR